MSSEPIVVLGHGKNPSYLYPPVMTPTIRVKTGGREVELDPANFDEATMELIDARDVAMPNVPSKKRIRLESEETESEEEEGRGRRRR